MGKEFDRIGEAIKKALGNSKRFGRTAENIKRQKANGQLDYKFKKFIKSDFQTVLKDFISILEDQSLEKRPNYKRIKAYTENDFLQLFESYGFELGSWLTKDKDLNTENNKSFFNFPLFFKEACRKCCIPKYAKMSEKELKELLGNFIDLRCSKSVRPRKDRDTIEDETLVIMHTKSPSKNSYNTAAEDYAYRALVGRNNYGQVTRVTRDCGSGYGFDLISLDGEGETLITVKACDNMESFILSSTEHDAMIKAESQPYTTYYVYKFLFKEGTDIVKLFTIYKYDKDNDLLVDMNDSSNVCNIEEKEYTIKNGTQKTRYICTPVKFKFKKSAREKMLELKNMLLNKNSNN